MIESNGIAINYGASNPNAPDGAAVVSLGDVRNGVHFKHHPTGRDPFDAEFRGWPRVRGTVVTVEYRSPGCDEVLELLGNLGIINLEDGTWTTAYCTLL